MVQKTHRLTVLAEPALPLFALQIATVGGYCNMLLHCFRQSQGEQYGTMPADGEFLAAVANAVLAKPEIYSAVYFFMPGAL